MNIFPHPTGTRHAMQGFACRSAAARHAQLFFTVFRVQLLGVDPITGEENWEWYTYEERHEALPPWYCENCDE